MIQNKAELEAFITSEWFSINKFIDKETEKLPLPLYTSVDIRESGHKFAPVDSNLYPCGFNNLCQKDLFASGKLLRQWILSHCPEALEVAIITEGHTRNGHYLDHLLALKDALEEEGFRVTFLGPENLFEEKQDSLKLYSALMGPLVIEKAVINHGHLCTKDHTFDVAILNNDQSSPLKIDWKSIRTPVFPTPFLGWYGRQKIDHFLNYQKVIEKFSKAFSIDPDLLQAKVSHVDNIDLSTRENLEKLSQKVDEVSKKLSRDSKIFVKAGQGTYGMGIFVVKDGRDILHMNRKTRNKMDTGKNKIKFTSLLVQEGIESVVRYKGMPAEVTIYLIGGTPCGGFLRTHPLKGADENLNSKGVIFHKYCISELRRNSEGKEPVYSILGKLATWACALEIQNAQGPFPASWGHATKMA